MFVDLLKIRVKAGKGGDGLVSFRREKFVERGGPNGGNGGSGGSIIFVADKNKYDLADLKFLKLIRADDGQPGGSANKQGRSGSDVLIKVPLGTLIRVGSSEVLADLTEHGERCVAAAGGAGGFGNAHFKSSTNRTPLVAEKGLAGEEKVLECELKLLAEAGLVGLPNAGKSTFLGAVSSARPKVGAYPFTTLQPHLGVSRNSCLIADIPGLIAGAAKGKGLGHQFLRHVERNLVILHLIDVGHEDPAAAFRQIATELKAYDEALCSRPMLVALTKIDTVEPAVLKARLKRLEKAVADGVKVYAISALANLNLDGLLADLKQEIARAKARAAEAAEDRLGEGVPVFGLKDDGRDFRIERLAGRFIVHGRKIETFALKTDFDNFHARRRLLDIMGKMGITKQLQGLGCETEPIVFGREEVGRLSLYEEAGGE
ncbi:GTPase ObgE [Candidatus Saccharibacteria bacterium]|nr:GTPase ObgE [Candidatus Saccharibacteria bacterium]